MVLTRTDFGTFSRKRDMFLKCYRVAPSNVVDRWKKAWNEQLSELPYVTKVESVKPTNPRHQVAMLCRARFVRLNLEIAQADMESFFALHAKGAQDTCYSMLVYPQRIELHFAELSRTSEVVSGVVMIAPA